MSTVRKRLMNILLVDDDEMVLMTVGDFLTRRGHRVRTATDGSEALQTMAAELPDLVVSDIRMPKMDGIAFLKAVRVEFPDLPVILMTEYATVETAVAALRNGANDYLKKPVRLQELQACMERVERDDHLKT